MSKKSTETKSAIYTYVGQGEEPPRKINFMGRQEFVRGQMTEVTDPELLAKLENHPCFTTEEVDQEVLHDRDEEAAKEANEQRLEDRKTNAAYNKAHKTE